MPVIDLTRFKHFQRWKNMWDLL